MGTLKIGDPTDLVVLETPSYKPRAGCDERDIDGFPVSSTSLPVVLSPVDCPL